MRFFRFFFVSPIERQRLGETVGFGELEANLGQLLVLIMNNRSGRFLHGAITEQNAH